MLKTREQAIEIIQNYIPSKGMKIIQELVEETAEHFNYVHIVSSWRLLSHLDLPYLANLCIREEGKDF